MHTKGSVRQLQDLYRQQKRKLLLPVLILVLCLMLLIWHCGESNYLKQLLLQNGGAIHIGLNETYKITYQQQGYMFTERGALQKLSVTMTSARVHDFTPYVRQEAKRRFVDPLNENIFGICTPALTYHNGR